MNVKKIAISMVATSVLFTACGGGGGGGEVTPPSTVKKNDIKNAVKNFKVLVGQKKYVTVSTGGNVITAGEPNSKFKVVDAGGATATFDEVKNNGNNYGILKFIAPDAPGKYEVVVNNTNDGGTSSDTTFTFDVVGKSSIPSPVPSGTILAISRNTSFTNVGRGVHDDKTDLVWSDNDETDLVARTYDTIVGDGKCSGDWRLPTLNELLDLVDYSKKFAAVDDNNKSIPMISDKFNTSAYPFNYAWGESIGGKNYFVNMREGVSDIDTAGQPLNYRCVKGPKNEGSHFIFTDFSKGITYDASTGLAWSKAAQATSKSSAEGICSATIAGKTGWELPTINELRSIVENEIVPAGIVFKKDGNGQFLTLFSSTASDDDKNTATPLNYGLQLNWDRTQPKVTRFFTTKAGIDYGVTCVRPFSDSDIDDLLK